MIRYSNTFSLRIISLLAIAGFLCLPGLSRAQSVIINEIMAANTKTLADPDFHEYGDWIELYNPGTQSINLKGWSITDDFSKPAKYVFSTDIVIQPAGYLVIWADDHATGTHANFKLSASGERAGIFNAGGQVIDTVSFGSQQDDISWGRYPDGAAAWYFFKPATPGSANIELGIYNRQEKPQLSLKAGFYPGPVTLTLSHPVTDAQIRYTLNGKPPTQNSTLYTQPFRIDSTTVLKTAAFKQGAVSSKIVSATYFINENTSLPVLSLSTDPDNFFSDTMGIYVIGTRGITALCSTGPRNWNQDWERPVDIEFFEKDRAAGFSASAGVKIHGGCTRLYDMKSLAFYFRDQYGYSKLNYKLFPWLNVTEYNNFILRNSGQDWYRTMFRDAMVQTLIGRTTSVDVMAYKPAVVFLNGAYWGIHNIREKLNEHYVESHYGVNPDSVDVIEMSKSVSASNGTTVAYNALIDYLNSHDLSIAENYEYIKSVIDINNYVDYMAVEIYAANGDWPGNNTQLWRERSPNGKWRWMVYDLDYTFGGNSAGQYNTNTLATVTAENGPSYPNPPWSTLLLRKLLANPDFKNLFIQKSAAHGNITFRKEYVNQLIDSLAAVIAPELPRHRARWPKSISMSSDWQANIQIMRDFTDKRPLSLRGFYADKFALTGSYSITIQRNNSAAGEIYTADLRIRQDSLSNVFYKNIPVTIRAVANPGYHFVRWEGLSTSTASVITLAGNTNGSLTAIFDKGSAVQGNTPRVQEFEVMQNYPNPFNPVTTIGYILPEKSDVKITIYSPLGKQVQSVTYTGQQAGYHSYTLNALALPSGVWFYEISTPKARAVKKCLLVK
ncbi:MAG: CotH kinase family protein [Ignavibacteria bacterium]|nr:CotH kinase family protein [Ignavibacteria bacterium]